jgi:hypothetical protein
MRIKSILFFAYLAILIAACNTAHVTTQSAGPRNALFGLASPIQLQYDTTVVHMSDYFIDYQKITDLRLEGKSLVMDSTGVVQIIGNSSKTITSLKAVLDGNTYDIPVYKSSMTEFTFSYTPSKPDVQKVEMAGSINGWNRKATPLERAGDGSNRACINTAFGRTIKKKWMPTIPTKCPMDLAHSTTHSKWARPMSRRHVSSVQGKMKM